MYMEVLARAQALPGPTSTQVSFVAAGDGGVHRAVSLLDPLEHVMYRKPVVYVVFSILLMKTMQAPAASLDVGVATLEEVAKEGL